MNETTLTTVVNATTIPSEELNRAVGGLLAFISFCFVSLCALVVILFKPCKGATPRCPGCSICILFLRYLGMKLYSLCCCRCCKKGQRYLEKRAGKLQQDMERELEDWNQLEDSDDSG